MSSLYISPALRQRVARAFNFQCGYCQTSQRIVGPLLEIDHIIPEAKGGTNEETNLCLACPMCNSHKAAHYQVTDPESGIVTSLFNPRTDEWQTHFEWIEEGTIIRGKTPKGRATIVTLNMNHPDIVAARHLWGIAGWHPPQD